MFADGQFSAKLLWPKQKQRKILESVESSTYCLDILDILNVFPKLRKQGPNCHKKTSLWTVPGLLVATITFSNSIQHKSSNIKIIQP